MWSYQSFILIAATVLIGQASAQNTPTPEQIVANNMAALKAFKDVSFTVTGSFSAGEELQNMTLKANVKSIISQKLTRIHFLQPDMMADNIMVVEKNQLRHYMSLTDQIMVQDVGDVPELDWLAADTTQFIPKGATLKLVETTGKTGSRIFKLSVHAGKEKGFLWFNENNWMLSRVQYSSNEGVAGELKLDNYKINTGLKAAALKSLPKSAQVIR